MTISSDVQSKLKIGDALLFLVTLFSTITIGIKIIFEPYSRENIPITNLGGIFYRSIFVVLAMSLIWVWRYGWLNTLILVFTYYGFQEFFFTNIFFGMYGQNMFQYINYSVSWDIRIGWMLISVFGLLYLRWYRINYKSIVTGFIFFAYFMYLLYVWPFPYFNGEGNIPLYPVPQLQEFIYNLLSPIWFYFLVRVKK